MCECDNYIAYVNKHIANVKLVWKTLQGYLKDKYWLDDVRYYYINRAIEEHDMSKLSAEELYGYAQWFYPEDVLPIGFDKNKDVFNHAWNAHQKSNRHHWEYWVMLDKNNPVPLSIPFEDIIEMLCDWTAMSLQFGNVPSEWYEKNRVNMILHGTTSVAISNWIHLFDKVYLSISKQEGK